MQIWLLLVFFVGYFFIATEHRWGVDKAAVALILGMVSWMIIAAFGGDFHSSLEHSVIEIAEILFFLLGAMTIVGIIDHWDPDAAKEMAAGKPANPASPSGPSAPASPAGGAN